MITAKDAYKLYDQNAFLEFTTIEAVYDRIKTISMSGGGCSCQIWFSNVSQQEAVWDELVSHGYSVTRFNGNDDTINVDWYNP